MALYPDPRNPTSFGVPDLHDIIDRFSEGQLQADDYPTSDDPYQGISDVRSGGLGSQSVSGQTPENIIGADGFISGRAAEFATPHDLANYARTGSLATGDNGIGAFGHNTAGAQPFVAVPRDVLSKVYGSEKAANGKMVQVIAPNGQTAVIPIGDIGPSLRNRANNAVLELNPAAKALLGSGDSEGYRYRLLN